MENLTEPICKHNKSWNSCEDCRPGLKKDMGDVSDGFHTFNELYEHRIILFITLCKTIKCERGDWRCVWASKLHSDGTKYDGWFILGIGKEKGHQITYHLPEKYWDKVCRIAEVLEKAPEYDGHIGEDVLKRLATIGKTEIKKNCKHDATITGFTENGGLWCHNCGEEFLPKDSPQKELCQVCKSKPVTALMPSINKPNQFCRECFDNYMGQKAVDEYKPTSPQVPDTNKNWEDTEIMTALRKSLMTVEYFALREFIIGLLQSKSEEIEREKKHKNDSQKYSFSIEEEGFNSGLQRAIEILK